MKRTPHDYTSIWTEACAVGFMGEFHADLAAGRTVHAIVEPGDATRYEIVLAPLPNTNLKVSAYGSPERARSYDRGIVVTIMNGLGEGAAVLYEHMGADAIRDEIDRSIQIRNPCTRAALFGLLAAVLDLDGLPTDL